MKKCKCGKLIETEGYEDCLDCWWDNNPKNKDTDEEKKIKRLKRERRDKLIAELKDIPPRKFVSFDILKSHLPAFYCGGGDPDEESLDKLMDSIALELIEVYNG